MKRHNRNLVTVGDCSEKMDYIADLISFETQTSNSKTSVARESIEHATNECNAMLGNSNIEDGLNYRIYISWKLKFQIQNSNSKTNVARESMEHATNECMSGNSNREDGLSCRHRREWVKMKLSIQIIPILALLCGVCLLWYIITCVCLKKVE